MKCTPKENLNYIEVTKDLFPPRNFEQFLPKHRNVTQYSATAFNRIPLRILYSEGLDSKEDIILPLNKKFSSVSVGNILIYDDRYNVIAVCTTQKAFNDHYSLNSTDEKVKLVSSWDILDKGLIVVKSTSLVAKIDGDQLCVHRADFENLQESNAIFLPLMQDQIKFLEELQRE